MRGEDDFRQKSLRSSEEAGFRTLFGGEKIPDANRILRQYAACPVAGIEAEGMLNRR